jgi:predicted nucleic acid-binding Zn ribbon protein
VVTTPVEPTHGCARCGDPVPPGVGLCERCNPLGLKDVAASQAHGTVFVAVALAIVILAVVARLAVSGAGPFPATLDAVTPVDGGLALTLTVTNEGRSTGQTTCRIHDPVDQGGGPSAFVVSPRIQPGAAVSFHATVTEFGSIGRAFRVECRTP